MPIIDGVRYTLGRCFRCHIAYRWQGRPQLYDARCPRCEGRLYPTTRYLKSVPWEETKPTEEH